MTTPEPCPLFDETAGHDAAHLEALLSTRPPTAAEVIAAHPRTDDHEGGG